ncbi:hypothetical protein EBZ37_14650 [bacterium]|nr:hypothetical protein [bacterium]
MFTYKDFLKVFRECVKEKYNCCVLDVRESRGNPGKGIYYYCATDRTRQHKDRAGPAFRVGSRAFWQLSDYYFEDRSDYDLDPDRVRAIASGDKSGGAAAAAAPAPLLKKDTGIKVMRMPSAAKVKAAAAELRRERHDAEDGDDRDDRDGRESDERLQRQERKERERLREQRVRSGEKDSLFLG